VTRLGITGHQFIPEAAQGFVSETLDVEIRVASRCGRLCGITSLAAGADQLFAELILHVGGSLHVVVPCEQYEATFDANVDGYLQSTPYVARAALALLQQILDKVPIAESLAERASQTQIAYAMTGEDQLGIVAAIRESTRGMENNHALTPALQVLASAALPSGPDEG